jgi:copper chaperone
MAARNEWTLQIGGMTCMHCARAVDQALGQVPGVERSRTDHASGRSVVVAAPSVDFAALVAAIEYAGYEVLDRSSKRMA